MFVSVVRVRLFSIDNLKSLWDRSGVCPGSFQPAGLHCVKEDVAAVWGLHCGFSGQTGDDNVLASSLISRSLKGLMWCHWKRDLLVRVCVMSVCASSWLSGELCSSTLCVQHGENLSLNRVRFDIPTKSHKCWMCEFLICVQLKNFQLSKLTRVLEK